MDDKRESGWVGGSYLVHNEGIADAGSLLGFHLLVLFEAGLGVGGWVGR